MKKTLFAIFCLLFFSTVYLNSSISKTTKAQVVISVDNLLTTDVIESLRDELDSYPNVEFIEGSLLSSIIVLEVIDNALEISSLKRALNRWGCDVESITYRMLN